MAKNTERITAITAIVCEQLATSNKGLKVICKENGISSRTFYDWVEAHEDNQHQYARARELQADYLVEEMLEIADETSGDIMINEKGISVENREFVSRSRLKVDTRKWIAAKLRPKKYGDKIDVTSDNKELKGIVINLGVGIDPESEDSL